MALGITVDFNANLVKFEGQVNKMAGQLDKFQSKTESMAARANKALSSLGVGISVAGLAAFVKSGIDAADALNNLSSRSGIAVEKLAAMQLAVKLGDTTMESFVAASNKLSINIAKNGDEFKALGIDAKDPLEAFKQLSNVYSAIQDPQQRAAFGASAIGKAYAEMAPLLEMGADKINELIKKGQEQADITAEQAARAGEFNDRLDELANSSSGFRMKFAMGVLEPLTAFASEIDKAVEKGGVFMGTLEGLSNGYNKFIVESNGAGGGLTAELDALNRKIADAKQKVRDTQTTAADKAPVEIQAAQQLNNLLAERQAMLKQISDQRNKDIQQTAKSSAEVLAFDKALNDLIFKGGNEGDKPGKVGRSGGGVSSVSSIDAVTRAEESRLKAINEVISALKQDIEISKLSEAQQQRMVELSNSLKDAKGSEVQIITDLVNKKYDEIEADKRQSAQWEQLIQDANDYYDLRKNISDLSKSNMTVDSLSGGIGNIQDQLNAGTINAEQAKTLYDQLGRGFNESFIDPAKSSTEQLSEYGVQAARNMQSAFADFLFDPFAKGSENMLASFANIIKRMAAEAASAQIMQALFGATGKQDGGGLIGTLFSAVVGGALGAFGGGSAGGVDAFGANSSGRIVAGIRHAGGMVGGGHTVSASLAQFASAPRLHNGGYVLKADEVPTILQTGERVLNRKEAASYNAGGGDVQISTTVNVKGNGNQDNAQALGNMINARIKQVIVTEKRPGGLLA